MGLKAAMQVERAQDAPPVRQERPQPGSPRGADVPPRQPMLGDRLVSLHEELTRRALGVDVPPVTPADIAALHTDIDALRHTLDDLAAQVHGLANLLMLQATAPAADWKADLMIRLTSRKLWAFIAGLVTVIVTAWQTNPNPNVTIGAIAVAVVGYIASQTAEDRAKANVQAASRTETAVTVQNTAETGR